MKKLAWCLTMLVSMSTFAAEPELKPAQEEARKDFEEGIEEMLNTVNERCGTKLAVKTDFENFKPDDWKGIGVYGQCKDALNVFSGMCAERPAYKKAIAKKVTGVACLVGGAKGAEKKDGTNDRTKRNMSFDKGVFTFRMFPEAINVYQNANEIIEKALN